METVAVSIQNLCVPCCCSCSYCLLQSCKKSSGVDYWRGKALAERFVDWGHKVEIKHQPYYTVGYCADYPELRDNVTFNRSQGFVGAGFLQCNGIRIRGQKELEYYISQLLDIGIETIDITFFGNEKYHDKFAARNGDYRFNLQFAKCASDNGLRCDPTIVITEDNKNMLDAIYQELIGFTDEKNIHSFIPDYRGRGYCVEDVRIIESSYNNLSERIQKTLNKSRYKSERDWISEGHLPEYTHRALIISLTKDNIALFENMTCDEIVLSIEKLDDTYYDILPGVNELAAMYGDIANTRMYRLRDLFWKWQKRFIHENRIDIHDITDERICSTIRS